MGWRDTPAEHALWSLEKVTDALEHAMLVGTIGLEVPHPVPASWGCLEESGRKDIPRCRDLGACAARLGLGRWKNLQLATARKQGRQDRCRAGIQGRTALGRHAMSEWRTEGFYPADKFKSSLGTLRVGW